MGNFQSVFFQYIAAVHKLAPVPVDGAGLKHVGREIVDISVKLRQILLVETILSTVMISSTIYHTGWSFRCFLHMLTPHVINTDKGMQRARPEDCIVYKPGQPRYLHCPEESTSFRNSGVHFQGEQVAQRIQEYEIPTKKLFILKQALPIITTIQDITYEFSRKNPYKKQMQSMLVDMLLLQIKRNIVFRSDIQKHGAMQHYENFEHLRRTMYLNPEREWTIPNMAKRVFFRT